MKRGSVPKRLIALFAVLALMTAACGGSSDAGETDPTNEGGEATETPEGGTEANADGDAFDAEEYFAGRTIRVIVTHSEGGGSDLFARFVASRMSEQIPGNPRVTVTNEGGVGGIAAIYTAPEQDLVIGASSKAETLYSASVDPDAVHELDQIRIIGGTGGDARGVTVFGDALEYDSIMDASGSDGPTLRYAQTVGSPADVLSDAYFYSWLCENLDLPCEMISVADDDSTDQDLMIQRGEMNLSASSMVTVVRDFTDRILNDEAGLWFRYDANPNSEVVPPGGLEVRDIEDLLPEELLDDYEEILPMIGSGGMGKNFWAPPSLPDEIVKVLREAYIAALSDQSAVEELGRVMSGAGPDTAYEFNLTPMSGDEAQGVFEEAYQTFLDQYSTYQANQERWYEDWN